jgi:hypothetical protein
MSDNEDPKPVENAPVAVETPLQGATGAANEKQGTSVWTKIGIIIAVLIVILAIGAIFYGLVTHPGFTSVLSDIAIIVLALVTMITSILLAILLFQLQSLTVLLRNEIQPILESINQTTSTVRGTTTFVSDTVVNPVIQIAGYISGVRQGFRALFGGSGKQRTTQSRTTDERVEMPSGPAQGAEES